MQALNSASLGQIPAETHLIHSSILEGNQHCVWLSKLFCIDLVAVSFRLSFLSSNLKMPQAKVLHTKYLTPPFTPLSAKLITLQQKETKLVWQDSLLRNLRRSWSRFTHTHSYQARLRHQVSAWVCVCVYAHNIIKKSVHSNVLGKHSRPSWKTLALAIGSRMDHHTAWHAASSQKQISRWANCPEGLQVARRLKAGCHYSTSSLAYISAA